MNDQISEIIKDLSEAWLAIVSSICLILTTKQKLSSSKKSKKSRRGK